MIAVRPLAGARRRSVTAAPFRNHNDQIAAIERDMPDDYRQRKRAMHKAGVQASSSDNPGAVRHLRKQSLADVVVMENRAKAGEESARPKPPCIGLADVLLVLVYEAVAGECPRAAHPLDEPGGGPTSSRLVRSPMHLAALPSLRRPRRPRRPGGRQMPAAGGHRQRP